MAVVELMTIYGSKGFGEQYNMSIFTSYRRQVRRCYTAESQNSFTPITIRINRQVPCILYIYQYFVN